MELDEAVHFDGVFHGEFFDEGLDEAGNDHGAGFGFGHAAALQVEELLFADAGDAGFVAELDVLLVDFDVGISVAAAFAVEDESVTDDVGTGALGATFDFHQATVAGAAAVFGNAFADDAAGGIGSTVYQFRAGVLMLALGGEGDGKDFAAGAGFHHVDGGVFHGEAAAEVAVDPFHEGTFVGHGPLGDEVINVVGPVLDGGVAAAGVLFDGDFDHGRVKAFSGVHGGGAAFDVMHLGALVDDDEGGSNWPMLSALMRK